MHVEIADIFVHYGITNFQLEIADFFVHYGITIV